MDLVEKSFSAAQINAILSVSFENLVSAVNTQDFFLLCTSHFIRCMFHEFPENFLHGLQLILKG